MMCPEVHKNYKRMLVFFCLKLINMMKLLENWFMIEEVEASILTYLPSTFK